MRTEGRLAMKRLVGGPRGFSVQRPSLRPGSPGSRAGCAGSPHLRPPSPVVSGRERLGAHRGGADGRGAPREVEVLVDDILADEAVAAGVHRLVDVQAWHLLFRR